MPTLPAWLVQLSTVVIGFVLVVVFGGIVLSIILPRVRNALFYRAIGSLVEAATRKGHERDEKGREKEHQAKLRAERDLRVYGAVDKLTENLNRSLTVFEDGYNAKGASGYYTEVHRAIAELQLEGPQEIADQLAAITTKLAQGMSFGRLWVIERMTAITAIVRR